MDEVVFGRYRLIELIGEGGMGKVFKARDTEIEREVAVKVLPPELATEPGYQERFRREAHAAAQLAEPHVIPIYDTGEIDDQLYLVMPVIDGVDLSTLLERQGPMPAARAVGIVEQLGAALDTAHAAGLVHRDVKPSNTLLTADDFVYLIDFGIAHNASATKLTRTGSIVGTWAYMAPERFGTGIADARSDIYALTCVLYESLTGQPPFPGSLEQQVAAHLTAPPPRPSLFNPALGAGLDAVIARGMAKDPQQRYQTAEELTAGARQALTQAPPATDPLNTSPATFPATFPAPATATSFATTDPALMPAPIPPAAPTYPGPTMYPGPTTVPPGMLPGPGWPMPPPRPRRRWIIPAAAVAALALAAAIVVATAAGRPDRKTPAAHPSQAPTSASTTTSPTPAVAPERLDSILLTPQEVNAIMRTTGMQTVQAGHTAFLHGSTLSNPDCLESINAGQSTVYDGSSGFTAISVAEVAGQSQYVSLAAATFESVDQALAFVKNSAAKMGACNGQTVTESAKSQDLKATIANLAGDVPTITQQHEFSNGMHCQRALSTVLNVVVDANACAPLVTDPARQMVEKMATKVST